MKKIILIGTFLCAASVADAQKVYWTEPGNSRIMRSNPDGSDVQIVYWNPGFESPETITVDAIGRKIYWISNKPDGIYALRRANLDGSAVEELPVGASIPHGIAFYRPVTVPAVSAWGLAVMVLLLGIAATVMIRKRVAS